VFTVTFVEQNPKVSSYAVEFYFIFYFCLIEKGTMYTDQHSEQK